MSLTAFLYGLGSVPMFASRPFLAGLVTVLLARYGEHLPWIGGKAVVQALKNAPAWFHSDWFLALIAILAVLEAAASRSPDARELLREVEAYIKAGVALLVSLALIGGEDVKLLRALQEQSILGNLWSLLVAGGVLVAAKLRQGALALVLDLDEDDDIGLTSAFLWAESTWTVMGLLFLVIFPLAAVVLAALTTLGLHLARKRAERREAESQVGCAACGKRIHASAVRCPACNTPVAQPLAVGVFGQPRKHPAPDLALHRLELVARKRCPSCATRLTKRMVQQACPTCHRVTFGSVREFEEYNAALRQRLPKTLLICLGLSAIPLLGVIPGVIYYRLTIVSGLRGYIPPLSGCMTRMTVRLVNWGLIALQPIPLVGALIVPLMCAANYGIYSRALSGRARKELPEGLAGLAQATPG